MMIPGILNSQVMLTYDGNWFPVGSPQTGTGFSISVDICQYNIPDGPFLLSLNVTDQAGKTSTQLGTINLEKRYDCNPATSTPNSH